jgi:class 3 adenylate cyclase
MQLSSIMLEQTTPVHQGVNRVLAAILSADIVGYTRLMACDEEGTHARERRIRHDIINPAIAGHQGRVVKHTGDGFLAVFNSPIDAVRCAIAMQGQIGLSNAALPREQAIEFRMGINIGDVIVEPEDVFGDGVNIAARLQSIAETGGIFVSGIVYAYLKRKVDCAWASLGEKKLKNIPEPLEVYRLLPQSAAAAPVGWRLPSQWGKRAKVRGIAIAALLAAVASATIFATQLESVAAHPAQWSLQSRQSAPARREGADASKDADKRFVQELLNVIRTPELADDEILKRVQLSLMRSSNREQPLAASWSVTRDPDLKGHERPQSVALGAEPGRTATPGKRCDSAALPDAPRADPQDGSALLRRGQLHVVTGEYDCAIEDFDKVLQFNPGNVTALNNRCWSRAIIGRLSEALADCDEALRLRPSFSGALDSRGLVRLKLGHFDQAIADYDRALRRNAKQAESWYGRGIAKSRLNDAVGARADIERATAINPAIAQEFKRYGVPPA